LKSKDQTVIRTDKTDRILSLGNKIGPVRAPSIPKSSIPDLRTPGKTIRNILNLGKILQPRENVKRTNLKGRNLGNLTPKKANQVIQSSIRMAKI